MSKIYTCECCGREISDNERSYFDGQTLCSDCLDEQTVLCSHCNERIWLDDNAGSDDFPLCDRCYDNYYTTCEACGHIIHQDDANYPDDEDYAYCNECYEERYSKSIHEYSYKPAPIFYGSGNRFFGVELEIDYAGQYSENADKLLDIANESHEHIYIKCDGSLDEGMEIVTHPMTLAYHRSEMPWEELCKKAISMGYRSHKTSTCGLHIHINRDSFGSTYEAQESAISRVLYFVEHHWNELLKFSRRTESQMAQWAARYGYKTCPKEILDHAKSSGSSRYTCVNITNRDTIEFRMFRGTLKLNTLIATLELVDQICELAVTFGDDELAKISWSEFVTALDKDYCAELITYLKQRRLYVNPPTTDEEDE